MWTSIFIGIYVVVAFSIVLSILLYGAKPTKSLAWLLAIFAIPIGGIFLYLLLGRNRRRYKLIELEKDLFNKQPKLSHQHVNEFNGRYKKLMGFLCRMVFLRKSQTEPCRRALFS